MFRFINRVNNVLIGHSTEIRLLTFRTLSFRQSEVKLIFTSSTVLTFSISCRNLSVVFGEIANVRFEWFEPRLNILSRQVMIV